MMLFALGLSFGVCLTLLAGWLYGRGISPGGKRPPEGFAGSDDFSWPGKPLRFIDAETAARDGGA